MRGPEGTQTIFDWVLRIQISDRRLNDEKTRWDGTSRDDTSCQIHVCNRDACFLEVCWKTSSTNFICGINLPSCNHFAKSRSISQGGIFKQRGSSVRTYVCNQQLTFDAYPQPLKCSHLKTVTGRPNYTKGQRRTVIKRATQPKMKLCVLQII